MKHLKYLSYLLRHKWFVFVAGRKLGVSLWQLIIHDWSKFLPDEWTSYADYFYGDLTGINQVDHEILVRREKAFDKSWLLHQHRNPHHWQYWVLREDDGATKLIEIPKAYLWEMIADWKGAGRAITGKWGGTLGWYESNKDRILLDPFTRMRVEACLSWEKLP